MKEQYQLLQQEMLAAINQSWQSALPETEKAESCFRIAWNYWEQLKQHCGSLHNDADEIEFFRNIKPSFTCYMEYYLTIYEALVCEPAAYEQRILFWERETKEYDRFYKRNTDFVEYYDSNDRSMDNDYFLRSSNSFNAALHEKVYEDRGCRTQHDWLVRSLLANRMYNKYGVERLAGLRQSLVTQSK